MSLEVRAGIERRKAAIQNRVAEIKSHDKSIKKKLLISAGLGAAVFTTAWGVIPTLALRESGMLEGLTQGAVKTGLALGLSYSLNATSLLLNLNQGRRLLKNPQIETSQNFPATVIYHGLGKVESLKEERGKRSLAAVSAPTVVSMVTSAVLRESALLSFAALSPDKMREVVLLKSAQGVFNLIQAGAAEVVLRTKGREKKPNKNFPPSGTIVDVKRDL